VYTFNEEGLIEHQRYMFDFKSMAVGFVSRVWLTAVSGVARPGESRNSAVCRYGSLRCDNYLTDTHCTLDYIWFG
jgi:hypothetical protein